MKYCFIYIYLSLGDYNVTKECSIQLFASSANKSDEKQTQETSPPEEGKLDFQDEGGDTNVSDALKHGDVVIAKLVEARNLERADFWTGSSDPYVIFVLGSNSSKSKTIKRNVNPTWNELFGFRIKEEDRNAILSMLVFDFDNFTPDDFIGSAEINLSELKRGELVDKWVKLDNVKTGELHLQLQRCIITSPHLNNVLTKLITLERSWDDADLLRSGITLEQLTGEVAWITKDSANPALEHLASSVSSGQIDWVVDSLKRVEKILHTQNVLPTSGFPTRHLWISGIASDLTSRSLLDRLQKIAVVKHVQYKTGQGFAFVDYRTIDDALLTLLELQGKSIKKHALTIGFGKHLHRQDPIAQSCFKAGFMSINLPSEEEWRYAWLFFTGGSLSVFLNLQADEPSFEVSVKDCFICSQGINTAEVFDSQSEKSFFIRTEDVAELEEWKLVLRSFKNAGVVPVVNREDRTEDYQCFICKEQRDLSDMFVRDQVDDPACFDCLREAILSKVAGGDCNSLNKEFTIQDVRELTNADEFERYLETSLSELLEVDDNFVKCPSCKISVEFVSGNRQDAPDFQRLLGLDNKRLAPETQQHYLHNRVRCRNSSCSINFCRSCMEVPYHVGFDCQDYQIYKVADHCRFCDAALMPRVIARNPPSHALIKVCNSEECTKKRDQSCVKTLNCGCPCGGVRGEEECLPCMKEEHKPYDIGQSPDDFCNICFTESLGSSPCIQLDCSHVFHFECIKKRLDEGWSSAQITFKFSYCPLCQIKICHPLLEDSMKPIKSLHKDIELKAHARAEYEHLLSDPEIAESTGSFYRNSAGYAMDHFAYYMCFKCKNPYFGGQPRCNDGLDRFDPSELICGSCSGVGVEECPKHGKDYIIFKCRFCCSPSTWYCWGTTHFCDGCHRRQEAHDYMTTKTADQLPQCLGPDSCPLRIEHPPNGVEFSLGCGLCKGGTHN